MSELIQDSSTRRRGRGIGTVIGCVVAAIAIGSIWDDDAPYRPTVNVAWADDNREENATSANDTIPTSFSIDAGAVVIAPTEGKARVEFSGRLRDRATVSTVGTRMTIRVEGSTDRDDEIRLFIPRAAMCEVELMAGLLRSEGLPCESNTFKMRSGKMIIDNVPSHHGALRGEVGVGSVRMKDRDGPSKRSAGVGELRAELPGSLTGPTLTARVDVGMLTVDVD
jgi:hypothetical protein